MTTITQKEAIHMSRPIFTSQAVFDATEGTLQCETSALGATPIIAAVAGLVAGYTYAQAHG